jgi:peptidoglycan/LPS O-acetylase OafA/YrhL
MTVDPDTIIDAGLSSLVLATVLLALAVTHTGSGPIAALVATVGLAAAVALIASLADLAGDQDGETPP